VLENGNVFEKAAVNTTISRLAKAQPERLKNLIHDHPQFKKMLDRAFFLLSLPLPGYLCLILVVFMTLNGWNTHGNDV
jgi:hypothetical protein